MILAVEQGKIECVNEIFGLYIQYPPLMVHSFLLSRKYMWHIFWKRYDGQVSKFQWFEHERLHIDMINISILAYVVIRLIVPFLLVVCSKQ